VKQFHGLAGSTRNSSGTPRPHGGVIDTRLTTWSSRASASSRGSCPLARSEVVPHGWFGRTDDEGQFDDPRGLTQASCIDIFGHRHRAGRGSESVTAGARHCIPKSRKGPFSSDGALRATACHYSDSRSFVPQATTNSWQQRRPNGYLGIALHRTFTYPCRPRSSHRWASQAENAGSIPVARSRPPLQVAAGRCRSPGQSN
jgi:hypothetical protein